MKNKKTLSMILAVATASVTALSVVAGCKTPDGCDHAGGNAYRLTEVLKEATCSAKGKEQRTCGLCGDVKDFDTAIDPDNHDYGDWVVDNPSETTKGKAVMSCKYNSAHKKEVVLPEITGTTYESEITKRPTSVSEGEKTYTYESEQGVIKFVEVLPVRGLETMEDYIYMATSLGGNVRRSVGFRNDAAKVGVTANNPNGTYASPFSYEFGEDFTYVVDASYANEQEDEEEKGRRYWYSLDENGKPFGVYQEVRVTQVGNSGSSGDVIVALCDPEYVTNVTADHLKGFQYTSGGDAFITYGAEDALLTYYEAALHAKETGNAVNYQDSSEDFKAQPSGEYIGWFSYSYYWGSLFCRYRVDFTLYSTYEIKSLSVSTEIIRAYMIAEDEEGNKLFYEDGDVVFAEEYESDSSGAPMYQYDAAGEYVYDTDAQGNPVYKKDSKGNELKDSKGNPIRRIKPKAGTKTGWYSDNHEQVSYRLLNYTLQTLKTPDDVPLKNQYKPDSLYVKSFGLEYDGKAVTDATLDVSAVKEVKLSVKDIAPATASLKADPLRVFVRLPSGDVPLTMTADDNPKKVRGSFSETGGGTISLNFYSAETVTIVVKSVGGAAEKVVNFNVLPGAPSSITGEAYTYSTDGGYISYGWDSGQPASVLVNKPLYLRANADDGIGYADTRITVMCGEMGDNDVFVPDERITFREVEFEGETVIEAVATQADTYYVYMFCVADESVFADFEIEVKNPPSYASLLGGEYETVFGSFKPSGSAIQRSVTAKFTIANSGDWTVGTIVVEIGEDDEKKTWVYSYSFDTATEKLTTSRVSGDPDSTYDFTFGINDEYSLTVTHPTGVSNVEETRALYVPAASEE